MITKKDIITSIAEKENVPKTLVSDILNDTIDVILESLKSNNDVKLAGLGTFSVKTIEKRKRINKKTGELITPEPYNVPAFDIDVAFKETLSSSF